MKVIVGSNTFHNTSGILVVRGKKQISLEIGDDGQLLMTMEVYDSARNHIAKLRRNAWAFNKDDKFEVTTSPTSLRLMNKETHGLVVEVNVEGKDIIRVQRGKFYTHEGTLLEITPQFWSVGGGVRMSGNIFEGGSVVIG